MAALQLLCQQPANGGGRILQAAGQTAQQHQHTWSLRTGQNLSALRFLTRLGCQLQVKGLFHPQTPQEYLESYLKQLNQEGSEVNPLHAFAYDAVWVAARVLVQVKETAKLRRKFGSLRNISFGEEEEGKMLLEAVKSTQFEGVTVRTHTPETQRQAPIWFLHRPHVPVLQW